MHKIPIIRKILAAVMLVIFAFSIMPRKFLHDWAASHKDKPALLSGEKGLPQVSKAGYNCHCDNLVAESPFIGANKAPGIYAPRYFAGYTGLPYYINNAPAYFLLSLRGPPAYAATFT